MSRGQALVAALAVLGSCAVARAAPSLTVVPVAPGPGPAPPLQLLANELALRCPKARHLPFQQVAPLVPAWSRVDAVDPSPPPPDLKAEFFHGEDGIGTAVRFSRIASDLERDPVALLSQPARRAQLREAYLYAARAFLQAGDPPGAQDPLGALAIRLGDLPGADPAQWGPALAAADQQVRGRLPQAVHQIVVEGPDGWAVHVDEQPVGALPQQRVRLRPGRHAVVVVGPDGTRVSWRLELPAGPDAGPLRLIADRLLLESCPIAGLLGICSTAATPASAPVLARLLGSDLLLLRQREDLQVEGLRLDAGHKEGPRAAVSLSAGTDQAATLLLQRLCPAGPPPEQVATSQALPALRITRPARRRSPIWPGAVLLGAGVLAAVAAVPYFVYDGRCVDDGCVMIYDFHRLAPGIAGAGAALAIGGSIWLGLALRR